MTKKFISNIDRVDFELFHGVCLSAQYNSGEYHLGLYKSLGISIPDEIRHARLTRAAEFLAGRYLSALCLNSLQSKITSVAVGLNREPIFPKGFIGSISHSHGFVICMVSKQTQHAVSGIDVEYMLEGVTCGDIYAYVINTSEQFLIDKETHSPNLIVTLFFSIKESVFKALFPFLNKFFDFNALSIIEVNWESCMWSAVLNYSLTEQLHKGKKVKGGFKIDEYKVISWINLIEGVVQ